MVLITNCDGLKLLGIIIYSHICKMQKIEEK